MDDALATAPDAVLFSGAPEAIWAAKKPAFEKAGVSMVPLYVGPAAIDGPVIGNVAADPDNQYAGKVLADWFIVNSSGTGTAAIQSVGGFPVIDVWVKAFQDEVAAECKACTVEVVPTDVGSLAQGTAVQSIISTLQSNRDIGYVFSYNTNFVPGITNELQNAGLPDVRVGGWSATSDGIADIVRGKDYAWMMLNTAYSGWLAVHTVLNHEAGGAPVPPEDQILPQRLVTSNNASEDLVQSANSYSQPQGYQDDFKRLWGVQ